MPELEEIGVDYGDFVSEALASVTVNDEVFAMPFDLHTLLYHMNVDIFQEAELIDENGNPLLPSSVEELFEHAQLIKDRTGKAYFALGVGVVSAMPVRLWHTFMAQQDIYAMDADGKTANVDTPEGRAALQVIADLIDQGYVVPNTDYGGSEQAFIRGDAAVLINGTWVVDAYTAQAANPETALANYAVTNFPQIFPQSPGVWADGALWAIPRDPARPAERREAALQFLKFLNDNNFHWAKTGHLPVRRSVLESEEYAKLPQRTDYADTADIAVALPMIENQRGIQDIMGTEFNAVWMAGKSVDEAISTTQTRVEQLMAR
jgi:multiple sugar transport system substrate-binding protein